MKTLTPDEIECLLGVRQSGDHPLDILGYGYTSEGASRFRSDHPDFVPQIAGHVQSILRIAGIFPKDTDPADAGYQTFIRQESSCFRVSYMEEVGLSRFDRLTSPPMSEKAAIEDYIRRVTNPDYVYISEGKG